MAAFKAKRSVVGFVFFMAILCAMWGTLYCGGGGKTPDAGIDAGKDGGTKDAGVDGGGSTDGGTSDGGGDAGGGDGGTDGGGYKPNGDDCTADSQCISGICTLQSKSADGGDEEKVCCDKDCSGKCQTCKSRSNPGSCVAVAQNEDDPKSICIASPTDSCGENGKCSGVAGICQKWGTETICEAAICDVVDGGKSTIIISAKNCNGQGQCVASLPSTDCNASGNCQANSHCECVNISDSDGGHTGAICLLSQGQPCNADGGQLCATIAVGGTCADGHCCHDPCNGLCEQCNMLDGGVVDNNHPSSGYCDATPKGQSGLPGRECSPTEPEDCGQNGLCTGLKGICAYWDKQTVCQEEECDNPDIEYTMPTYYPEVKCTGDGTPCMRTFYSCSPFMCAPDGGTKCATTCNSSDDCFPPDGGTDCTDPDGGHTGTPKKCGFNDGHECNTSSQCANQGCCSDGGTSECTNINNHNIGNCGSCGFVCGTKNADAGTDCVGRICTPVCNSGCAVCDGKPQDGCNTNFNDPARSCANAEPVNIDKGKVPAGNTCVCTWGCLGCSDKDEDMTTFTPTKSDVGSKWYSSYSYWNTKCDCDQVKQGGDGSHSVYWQNVNLAVPVGVTYKICLYYNKNTASCPLTTPDICSNEISNGSGSVMAKMISPKGHAVKKDTVPLMVEIRYVSKPDQQPPNCAKWQLTFQCINDTAALSEEGVEAMMSKEMSIPDQGDSSR